MRVRSLGGALGLALLIGAGCGGNSPVPVRGTVTLDGNPVAGAVVLFIPEGAGGAWGLMRSTSRIAAPSHPGRERSGRAGGHLGLTSARPCGTVVLC